MNRSTFVWAIAAFLGIAVTAALAWSVSQVAGQRIGLAAAPLSAIHGLAPQRSASSPRRPLKDVDRHKAKHSITSAVAQPPAPTVTVPATAPPATQPAQAPPPPSVVRAPAAGTAAAQARPSSSSGGSGSGGRDDSSSGSSGSGSASSGSHRDD